jgi:signal transduction histidine kinase
MHQNKLFHGTRLRLAGWYAGVMGIILCLFGFVVYQVMARAHWYGLDSELESVSGTLHDMLEPNLQQPGQISPAVQTLLPNLCPSGANCSAHVPAKTRHVLGIFQEKGYYLRFLSATHQLIGTIGYQPESIPVVTDWQTLEDSAGNRFHQVTVPLKTRDNQFWGYMQIGQSLKEYDDHLHTLKLLLIVGLPLTLLLITIASWWLAGLAMRPVYQSYHQIQQFTADAAHELRTPLAAIRATVESALQASHLSEGEARSTLTIVERQNTRLSQLVQDLLWLTRMDIHRVPIKAQRCCLNDLVSDVVEEFAALAIAADVTLTAKIQSMQTMYVSGDEEQLYRALANLVTNAIQYTPSRGQITLQLEQDDQEAVIQVQDTGVGISPMDQAHLFDRFYRVNSDRSRATGGAGLGLAIVQVIVRAHQGTIQVQSELGQGSTFTVRLPLKLGRVE